MRLSVTLVVAFVYLSLGNGRIMSIGSFGDDVSELDFSNDRDDCVDGLCALYAEKRVIVPEHRQLVPRSYESGDSASIWKPVCGCVTRYKLVNLGEEHYPRYITTAKCKPNTCSNKFYQCKYYDYRVHVLVKRGMNSILKPGNEFDIQDVEELTLPESLHANWQLLSMSVPVACVAVERT